MQFKTSNQKITNMEGMIFFIVCAIIAIIMLANAHKNAVYEAQKSIADKERAVIVDKERAIEKAKKDEEWMELLARRESQFGKLTKKIQYGNREKSIYLYQDAKIIILESVEYSFNDIISVKIETCIKYGKETHITKPDAGELATQKMLYGMNKNYNVKEITTVTKTPDITYYDVYIYLNNLDCPCLKYDIGTDAKKANNICALIEVVIRSSNNNKTELS